MLKGLLFFIKHSWKYDRLYIIWRVAYQFVNSLIPIIATLLPKYIIDELMGQKRPETLMLYVGVLAGYTLLATGLSVFWGMDGFTRRCGVNAEFDSRLHQLLYEADFANIENPEFLDMQEKAKKFLYCDWHGFGSVSYTHLDVYKRQAEGGVCSDFAGFFPSAEAGKKEIGRAHV